MGKNEGTDIHKGIAIVLRGDLQRRQEAQRRREPRKAQLPVFKAEEVPVAEQPTALPVIVKRKVRLNESEVETCRTFFNESGPMRVDVGRTEDLWRVKGLFQSLGQTLSDEEVVQMLTETQRNHQYLDFDGFLSMMEQQKRKHITLADDPELDTLEAFVALGGRQDKTGVVLCQRLTSAINSINQCSLTEDIKNLIDNFDSELDWEQFCIVFNDLGKYHGLDARKSMYSDIDLSSEVNEEDLFLEHVESSLTDLQVAKDAKPISDSKFQLTAAVPFQIERRQSRTADDLLRPLSAPLVRDRRDSKTGPGLKPRHVMLHRSATSTDDISITTRTQARLEHILNRFDDKRTVNASASVPQETVQELLNFSKDVKKRAMKLNSRTHKPVLSVRTIRNRAMEITVDER